MKPSFFLVFLLIPVFYCNFVLPVIKGVEEYHGDEIITRHIERLSYSQAGGFDWNYTDTGSYLNYCANTSCYFSFSKLSSNINVLESSFEGDARLYRANSTSTCIGHDEIHAYRDRRLCKIRHVSPLVCESGYSANCTSVFFTNTYPIYKIGRWIACVIGDFHLGSVSLFKHEICNGDILSSGNVNITIGIVGLSGYTSLYYSPDLGRIVASDNDVRDVLDWRHSENLENANVQGSWVPFSLDWRNPSYIDIDIVYTALPFSGVIVKKTFDYDMSTGILHFNISTPGTVMLYSKNSFGKGAYSIEKYADTYFPMGNNSVHVNCHGNFCYTDNNKDYCFFSVCDAQSSSANSAHSGYALGLLMGN